VVKFTLSTIKHQKTDPAINGQDAGWAAQPFWMWWEGWKPKHLHQQLLKIPFTFRLEVSRFYHLVSKSLQYLLLLYSSIFWDIMLCSLLEVNRCFGRTCCLHLSGQKISQARKQCEAGSKPSVSNVLLNICVFVLSLIQQIYFWIKHSCTSKLFMITNVTFLKNLFTLNDSVIIHKAELSYYFFWDTVYECVQLCHICSA
jgi:hypothetical protein